jgi:hypothetical protein
MYQFYDLKNIYRHNLLFAIKLFLFTLFLLFTQEAFSTTLMKVPKTDSFLVATKGTKQFEYKLGTHLLIRYNNASNKISGQLYQVSNDSIGLIRNSKLNSIRKVAIKDISSITILHKAGRKYWGIFLPILLILALPIVSLFTYIPFLFFNFLSDVFSKKSISRGWSFAKRSTKQ